MNCLGASATLEFSFLMFRVDIDMEDGGILRFSGISLTWVAFAMPVELKLEGPDFSFFAKLAISRSFLALAFLTC